jgi:carbon-monoxide dehydrogenase large subunit
MSIAAGRFVGQRLPRKEDARLLTGKGAYVDDVVLAGMMHVAFVRSPIARGRVKSIDISAARALPGVRAIYTAKDLAQIPIQMTNFFLQIPAPGQPVQPLSDGRVAQVGDPIALVIAESRYIAEDAVELVMVDYEQETPVVTISDAKTGAKVHPDVESNVAQVFAFPDNPLLEEALKSAPHVVTGAFKHQRIVQSPMEGRGVVAAKNGEGELTIHIGCQSPHMVARYVSLSLGLPATSIRVISKDVGGSFGLKSQPWREEIAVIAAAMLYGRPLKWIEDRLENLTCATQAREQECLLRMAFDKDAKLQGVHLAYDINNGAYPYLVDANIAVLMFFPGPYKIPLYGGSTTGWYSNTMGLSAYRGPWAMETLVRECLFDIAAREIGVDPIEIRRRNLITKADQPTMMPSGVPVEDVTVDACLDALLKEVDVAAFRKEQTAARAEGRYLGIGVAAYVEPTGGSSMAPLNSDFANIRIDPTGKVVATLSTHSQGHGTQTTMAQVIAEQLGVRFEDVSIFEDDSSRGGFGAGASGSRQAIAGGGAGIKASEILLDKVKRIAAHVLNANPDDVKVEDGVITVSGVKETSRTLREIAEIAYNEPMRMPPDMEAGLEAQYRYSPPPITLTSAAHACIVEVDRDTGFVKIKRWVAAEDCGVMINPSVVEGQIAGGLAQAIGTVLLEEMTFDEQGNPTAATFKDYLLPTVADVPEFEYLHVGTPSKAVGGFRGVGEGGAIIGPPTLVNAINDALAPFGARFTELPLTPSKLMALMENGSPS